MKKCTPLYGQPDWWGDEDVGDPSKLFVWQGDENPSKLFADWWGDEDPSKLFVWWGDENPSKLFADWWG